MTPKPPKVEFCLLGPVVVRRDGVALPVRPHTEIEDYEFEMDDEDGTDLEAAGGVA